MKQYTPSSIKKMLKCKGFETSPTSQAMERGSILHDMLSGNEYSTKYSSYKNEQRQYQFEHDIEALQEVADQVKTQYSDIISEYISESEIQCNIDSPLNGRYQLVGIVDRYLVSGENAHIVDWKSGRTRLDVESPLDMLQSLCYSYIVFCMYPQVQTIVFDYIYIEGDDVQTMTLQRKDIEHTKHIIDSLVFATLWVGMQVGEHCKYCQRADKCPLVDANLKQVAYKEIELETLKMYKKIITKSLELRKETLSSSEDGKLMLRQINYNYVSKSNLQAEDLFELVGDEFKISKTKAEELKKRGIETYTKTSFGF